jgi:simple sugar transport system ATP-binding protein
MVGRSTPVASPPRRPRDEDLLRLDDVALAAGAPPVNLRVGAGEVVGIVGVDGNGQSELFEVLAGLRAPAAGRVLVAGRRIADFSPAAMQRAGVGVIPPDRRLDGLVADMSVRDNLVLSSRVLARFTRRGVLRRGEINAFARSQAERYNVRASALDTTAGTLSGGNQQRIVVARALAGEPRVLVAVNPTSPRREP